VSSQISNENMEFVLHWLVDMGNMMKIEVMGLLYSFYCLLVSGDNILIASVKFRIFMP
jgi:hypothetical protein